MTDEMREALDHLLDAQSFEKDSGYYLHAVQKAKAALASKPCPHVYTSKGGTSHCTLAASDAERVKKLVAAAKKTIEDNGHLADGDNCTLYDLREALVAITGEEIE